MYTIDLERPEDSAAIEELLDLAFGRNRHEKSAYRLREGVCRIDDLCFVARGAAEGESEPGLLGSVRFWPIEIGARPALLLGPLAVVPERQGNGLGISLIKHALGVARELGHELVILVGDKPYYGRAGFRKVEMGRLEFPGPVDPERLLMHSLNKQDGEPPQGVVRRAR